MQWAQEDMEDKISPSFAWTQKHNLVSLSLTSTPRGPAAL